jgi:cytochrome d ubiquinol oxidase subunit I
VIFKVLARRTRDTRYDDVARFWARVFGVNIAFGVATGTPLEIETGTNSRTAATIRNVSSKACALA